MFLGSLESSLMELIWKHGDLTVKKAMRLMGPDKAPAYTTVMTVLTRLAEKGLLYRHLVDRIYIYRPNTSRDEFVAERLQLIRDCISRNFKEQL